MVRVAGYGHGAVSLRELRDRRWEEWTFKTAGSDGLRFPG
jgi:hypothetical protein